MTSKVHTRRALINAIKSSDTDAVQQLIETDPTLCSSDAKIRKGDNPLHFAARLGLPDIVKCLLTHSAVNAANNDGKTALHEAALEGHEDVMKILIENGAEIDCLKAADWTPLMLACAKSHLACVQLLVQAHASLTRVNKDGWSAFHIAAREGDVEVLKCLLDVDSHCWQTESRNGRTPLHSAVIHGRYEGTQFLLSQRCAYIIEKKDSCGSTPLMDALRKGYVSIAQLLIEQGASPMVCNALGRNCYHVVAEAGEVVSLHFLCSDIGGGAALYLNKPDDRGTTCLHLAAKEGHAEMVQQLLELGANSQCLDSMGRTALAIAVLCKNEGCMVRLQQYSSD